MVELAGEMDRITRDSLADALEQAVEEDSQATVLDLSNLEVIDHAGAHTILTAQLQTTDQLKS